MKQRRTYSHPTFTLLGKARTPVELAVLITLMIFLFAGLQNVAVITGFSVADELVGLPITPDESAGSSSEGDELIGLPKIPEEPTESSGGDEEIIGIPESPPESTGSSSGGDELIGLPIGESPPANATNETEEIVGIPEDELVQVETTVTDGFTITTHLNTTSASNVTGDNVTLHFSHANFTPGDAFTPIPIWYRNNISLVSFYTEFDIDDYPGTNQTYDYGPNKSIGMLGTSANGDGAEPTWRGNVSTCLSYTGCYEFDGTADYITFPSWATRHLPPYSIEFWVLADTAIPVSNQFIVTNGGHTGASSGYVAFLNTSGHINFRINTHVGDIGTNDLGVLNNQKWNHLILTWDGTADTNAIKLYQNGTLVGQTTPESTAATSDFQNLVFGNVDAYYFDGKIDMFREWSIVLPPEQVKLLYNESRDSHIAQDSVVRNISTIHSSLTNISDVFWAEVYVSNTTDVVPINTTSVNISGQCGALIAYSNTGGDWNDVNTWVDYCTPNNLTNVSISHNVTVSNASASANAVGITSGGHLRFTTGDANFTGNVTIKPGGVLTTGDNNNYFKALRQGGGLETGAGNITLYGILGGSYTREIMVIGSFDFMRFGSGSLIINGTYPDSDVPGVAQIDFGGNFAAYIGNLIVDSPVESGVNAQLVGNPTQKYVAGNITITSRANLTTAMAAVGSSRYPINVTGHTLVEGLLNLGWGNQANTPSHIFKSIEIRNGGTLNASRQGEMNLSANFRNNGTFISNGGKVIFTDNAYVDGFNWTNRFANLTINPGANVTILPGENLTADGTIDVQGHFDVHQNGLFFDNLGAYNDYVNVVQSDTLNLTGDLTISAWIKTNESTSVEPIVSKYNISTNRGYSFMIDGGRLSFLPGDGGVSGIREIVANDKWRFVAITVKSGARTLYVDGRADTNFTGAAISTSDVDLTIGLYGASYYDGSIDDVRIYNRSLNGTEIYELYNNKYVNNSDLALHLSFDEGNGSITGDWSGNDNNGRFGTAAIGDSYEPDWIGFNNVTLGNVQIQSGGVFNSTSSNLTITNKNSANDALSVFAGGRFTHNNGTVIFKGYYAFVNNLDIAGSTLWNLIFYNYGNIYAGAIIDNDFIIDDSSGQVEVLRTGNLVVNGDFDLLTGSLKQFSAETNTMTVKGGVNIKGTLDLSKGGTQSFGNLTIASSGTYNATAGTTNITNGNWTNSGSFTHNAGRVILGGGTGHNQSITGNTETTFFNLNITNGVVATTQEQNATILGVLGIASGSTYILDSTDKSVVLSFGNSTGGNTKIINSGTFNFAGNRNNYPSIYGLVQANPVVVTGTDFNWDNGGANSIINISNINYRIDGTTGGGGVTVIASGKSVNLDSLTVSAGDSFNATNYGTIITIGNDTADQMEVYGTVNLNNINFNTFYSLLVQGTTAILDINNISVVSIGNYALQFNARPSIRRVSNSVFNSIGCNYGGLYVSSNVNDPITLENDTFDSCGTAYYGRDILLVSSKLQLINATFDSVGTEAPSDGWIISRDHNKQSNKWMIYGQLSSTDGNSTGGFNGTNWTSSDDITLSIASKYNSFYPTSLNASNGFTAGNVNISNGTNLIGRTYGLSFGSLLVESGGIYNATTGTTTLTSENSDGRALNNLGTITHNNGIINITTTSNTTINTGANSLFTLEIATGTGNITLLNNTDLTGGLNVTSGTLDTNISGYNLTATNNALLVGTLHARNSTNITFGSLAINSGGTYNATTGITHISGQTTIFGNFNATSGTLSLGSGLATAHAVMVKSGGTLTGGSGTHTFGNLRNDGTWTATSGITTLNKRSTATSIVEFQSGSTFNHNNGTIIITQTDGTDTIEAYINNIIFNNLTINSVGTQHSIYTNGGVKTINIKNNLNVSVGTLATQYGIQPTINLNVTGNVIVNGTLLSYTGNMSFGSLNIASTGTYNATTGTTTLTSENSDGRALNNLGTINSNLGRINITTTSNATINTGASSLFNLQIATGTGNITLLNNTDLTGGLNITSGTLDTNTSGYNLTATNNALLVGTLHARNSTNITFGSLTINSGGTYNATTETTIFTELNTNSSIQGVFNLPSGSIRNIRINGTIFNLTNARGIRIYNVLNEPTRPGTAVSLGKYVNITSTTSPASAVVNISYESTPSDESEVGIYSHDGIQWSLVDNSLVDTVADSVGTNLTAFSELFGLFENAITTCAATIYTTKSGDWSDNTTWAGPCYPFAGKNVIVKHNITVENTNANASAIGVGNFDATAWLNGGHLRMTGTGTLTATSNFTINAGGVFTGGANNIWLGGVNNQGLHEATSGNTTITAEGNDGVAWNNQVNSKFIHNNGMIVFDRDFTGSGTSIFFSGNSSSNPANMTIMNGDLLLTNVILNITGNLVVTLGTLGTTTNGASKTIPLNVTGTTLIGGSGIINLGFGAEDLTQNDWSYFGGDVTIRNSGLLNTSRYNTTLVGHLTIANTGEFRTNGNVSICSLCTGGVFALDIANNATFNAKQSSGNITIGHIYMASGTIFNSTSGTLTLNSRQAGGTTLIIYNKAHFDHNNGLVNITQTVGTTLLELYGIDAGGLGGVTFNNFSHSTASATLLYDIIGSVGTESTFKVLGNFDQNKGNFDLQAGTIGTNLNVSGLLTIASGTSLLGETSNVSAGRMLITGTYNATTKNTNIYGSTQSGTLTVWNTISGTYNHNNGIVNIFSSGTGIPLIATGTSAKPFYNLYFLPNSRTLFYAPSGGGSYILEVRNNLTIGNLASVTSSNGNRIYDLKDVSIASGGAFGDEGSAGATVSRFNVTNAINIQGVLDASLSNWTISNIGSITIASGGTFNATNKTISLNNRDAGAYLLNIQSGGTFKHNKGNIRTDYVNLFGGLATNNQTFYDFTINQGVAELRLQGQNDFHIANNLTIEAGNLTMGVTAPYGLLNVTGNAVINSGGVLGWIFPASPVWNREARFGSLTINSGGFYNATTGTTTLIKNGLINEGTLLHNNGTFEFKGTGYIVGTNVTNPFYNLKILDGANISTLADNVTVKNLVNITKGTLSTKQGGLQFDGSDDLVVVPDPSTKELDFGINDFSLEAWYYLPAPPSNWKSIINKGASGSVGYGMEISSSNLIVCSINGNGGTNQHMSGPAPRYSKWQHVICVYDRDDLIYQYVDGELTVSQSYSAGNANSIDSGNDLRIGRFVSAQWNFPGSIADVRLYNRTLNTTEIREHYRGVYLNESNMVGHWPLDNGYGQNVTDYSNYDNNGYLGTAGGADSADPIWVNSNLDANSLYIDAKGIYNATSGYTNITGGILRSYGTFNHNNGTITFTDGAQLVINESSPAGNILVPATVSVSPFTSGPVAIEGNATIFGDFNARDGAMEFDGSDYVDLGMPDELAIGTNGSIEAWFKIDNLGAGYGNTLIMKGDGASWTNLHYIIFEVTGTNSLYLSVSDGTTSLQSSGPKTPALNEDTWYYITATWNGNTKCMYLDGARIECISSTIIPSTATAGNFVQIGRTYPANYYFDGDIDSVKFYNTTLSAAEVKDHYRNTFTAGDYLVGRYDFDEGSGSTTRDKSSAGNNGTLGSAVAGDAAEPAWLNANITLGSIFVERGGTYNATTGTTKFTKADINSSIIGNFTIISGQVLGIVLNATQFNVTNIANIQLRNVEVIPPPPAGAYGINEYVNITNFSTQSSAILNITYIDTGLVGINESSIRLWSWDAGTWTALTGTFIDGVNNYLSHNITSFSLFSGFYTNALPTIQQVILNTTNITTNKSTENLTAYLVNASDFNGNSLTHTYNWIVDGSSYETLILSFNSNASGGNANATRDYSLYATNATLGNATNDPYEPIWIGGGGIIGGAYHFDGATNPGGSGHYIALPDLAHLDDGKDQLTIEFWYKPNRTTGTHAIIEKYTGGCSGPYEIYQGSATLNFRIRNTTGGCETLSTGSVLSAGTWTHLAFTYNGTHKVIYADGEVSAIANKTGSMITNTYWVGIGATINDVGNATGYFINATLDEIRFYNRSLSQEQIRAHANLDYNITVSQETTGGQTWRVNVTPNDGTADGATVGSNALAVVADVGQVILWAPANQTTDSNLTPTFQWYNTTGTGLTYILEVDTSVDFDPPLTVNINSISEGNGGAGGNITNYTLTTDLERDTQYFWRVRATTGVENGSYSGPFIYNTTTLVAISLNVSGVNFVSLDNEETNDTRDDAPKPFVVQNDGNTKVNISINSTSLWTSAGLNTFYYQFNTSHRWEGLGFNTACSNATAFINMRAAPYVSACMLNYTDPDTAILDLNITTPPKETGGSKSAIVRFAAEG